MTTKSAVPTRQGEEVWELTVPGRVHVIVTNVHGRPQDATAVGKGSRLRLSTLDRQLTEENIRREEHNPFRNGMLIQVAGPVEAADGSNALTDEQMIELFNLKQGEFTKVLKDLSELNVRRLKVMSVPADASASQIKAIDDLIAEKWPIGGTTPTYEEMMGT